MAKQYMFDFSNFFCNHPVQAQQDAPTQDKNMILYNGTLKYYPM
jgi:hypothetical protein